MMLCLDAVGKVSQLWEVGSSEERNRLPYRLRECIVFDLDKHQFVDIKRQPWADEFIVLRAAVAEDLAKYGKCDPGRIRTFDTPLKRRVLYH